MEYKDYLDEQLVNSAGAGQGIPLEMMRRLKNSIENLDKSVKNFNETTNKQQNVMIELIQEGGTQTEQMLKMTRRITCLTWVIAILTFLMLIGLGVQIWIA